MTATDRPQATIDAASLGFAPSDGVLVRDTPFLADAVRAAHLGSVRSAVLAPLLVLCAASLFVTSEDSPVVVGLVAAAAGAFLVWTVLLLATVGTSTLRRALDRPLRSVSLAPGDIVLTRWQVGIRVGGDGGRVWVRSWFPSAHREILLRRRHVFLVRPGATRVVVLVPGSLALFVGRLRHSAPSGAHPPATAPGHSVSTVASRDVVVSSWLATNTRFSALVTVLLSASAAVLTGTSLPVLLGDDPVEDVAVTYGSAALTVVLLTGLVGVWLPLRRVRAAVAAATGWQQWKIDLHETTRIGTARYRVTATARHPDGRSVSVSARMASIDLVASMAETGRLWVLDTGTDSATWIVGVPGHPVLDTVTRRG